MGEGCFWISRLRYEVKAEVGESADDDGHYSGTGDIKWCEG